MATSTMPECSELVKASQTFNQMLSRGLYPDKFIYQFMIRSYAILSHFQLEFCRDPSADIAEFSMNNGSEW
ncbi:hypothetical protein AMTR_s00146p00098830 [Amborella trichopoda]|uniref:Pentatricopeptide repeat-containing protein n=1 Tax=Amborella trichopoda TaxID=13333 RepID=W1P4S0_AMBTC|nr:hypothetical protein AMTR_s00146p00098830 [Amborella trichopoda]